MTGDFYSNHHCPIDNREVGIRNMTFQTGNANPGAICVQYIANNQGSVRRVKIVCGGSGPIGLDLGYTNEQGPCLIQDVDKLTANSPGSPTPRPRRHLPHPAARLIVEKDGTVTGTLSSSVKTVFSRFLTNFY